MAARLSAVRPRADRDPRDVREARTDRCGRVRGWRRQCGADVHCLVPLRGKRSTGWRRLAAGLEQWSEQIVTYRSAGTRVQSTDEPGTDRSRHESPEVDAAATRRGARSRCLATDRFARRPHPACHRERHPVFRDETLRASRPAAGQAISERAATEEGIDVETGCRPEADAITRADAEARAGADAGATQDRATEAVRRLRSHAGLRSQARLPSTGLARRDRARLLHASAHAARRKGRDTHGSRCRAQAAGRARPHADMTAIGDHGLPGRRPEGAGRIGATRPWSMRTRRAWRRGVATRLQATSCCHGTMRR